MKCLFQLVNEQISFTLLHSGLVQGVHDLQQHTQIVCVQLSQPFAR